MGLFGRRAAAKAKPEDDVIRFFIGKLHAQEIDEGAIRAIIGSAVDCILPPFRTRLPRDRVVTALPVALCLARENGLRAVGLVDGTTLAGLEKYIAVVCGASPVSIGEFNCLSLAINGTEYPFFLMTRDCLANVETVPESIIVIGDQTLEVEAGVDEYAMMVVREADV